MKLGTFLTTALAAGTISLAGALAQTSSDTSSTQVPQADQTASVAPTDMNQDQIRQLQQALLQHGEQLSVDGIWGPETQNALRNFQQAQGMDPTGEPDSETLAALDLDAGASDTESAAAGSESDTSPTTGTGTGDQPTTSQ